MKLNNKGYMLVEIIISFTIAFAMLYFLMEIVISIKNISEDYYIKTKLETDQLVVTKIIMDDINIYNLKKVSVDKNDTIDLDYDINNNKVTKRITIDKDNKALKYGIYSNNEYNNDLYVKYFDKSLNIDMDNAVVLKCYDKNISAYVICNSDSDIENKILFINIAAYSPYSDINYGINIEIPFKKNDIRVVNRIKANFSGNNVNLSYKSLYCETTGTSCNVKFPDVTPNNGYSLVGWHRKNNSSIITGNEVNISLGDNNDFIMDTSESVSSKYIKFDYNGSVSTVTCSVSVNSITCDSEKTPNIPNDSGFKVLGWYDSSGNKIFDANQSVTFNSSHFGKTYYARVKEIQSYVYIATKGNNHAYTTSIGYLNGNNSLEFSNSGVASAIGCTLDTCYISAQSSSNGYSTTVVYKDGKKVDEFSNSGVVSAIGCTLDTCYISSQSSGNGYSTTVVYKNGNKVKEFNNSGVVSDIGCDNSTCYISSQSSGNGYSTTAVYKDENQVNVFNNSGVVDSIGCSSDICYIATKGNNHAYSTTIGYKGNNSILEFNNSGVVSSIGCDNSTCYISAQSSGNGYSTTVVYKNGNKVKEFNNSGVVSDIGCNNSTCYISSQSSGNGYSTTVVYKDENQVNVFNNSGVVKASGGNR